MSRGIYRKWDASISNEFRSMNALNSMVFFRERNNKVSFSFIKF